MATARRSSDTLRDEIRRRIRLEIERAANNFFPVWFMKEHDLLVLRGAESMYFWFVSPEGEIFWADYDSAVPRPTLETDPSARRAALEYAAREFPALRELLDAPDGGQPRDPQG